MDQTSVFAGAINFSKILIFYNLLLSVFYIKSELFIMELKLSHFWN